MAIAKRLAGFSLFEAEDLRKAIGKKIHALMASLKDKFLEGAPPTTSPRLGCPPALGRHARRRRTTRSTSRTPPATRSSPTAPPGCARTTRASTWPR